MNGRRTCRVATLAACLLATVATLVGCQAKGPAQRAGENMDKGVRRAKDAINPPGLGERAGRGIDKALNR